MKLKKLLNELLSDDLPKQVPNILEAIINQETVRIPSPSLTPEIKSKFNKASSEIKQGKITDAIISLYYAGRAIGYAEAEKHFRRT